MKDGLPQWVRELKPSIRAKVYEIPDGGSVDFEVGITVDGLHIANGMDFIVNSTRVLICEFLRAPTWSSTRSLSETFFELIILFWEEQTRLLFVNSSIENELYFDRIARCVVRGCGFLPVPLYRLQRVFGNSIKAQFVNVGMRNGTVGNPNEAYRMLTGPNAHLAVTRTDSRTHIKGHAFAKGTFDQGITSLGFTDSGKIWSMNKASGLDELIKQFGLLAQRIATMSSFITNSELDSLSAGEILTTIPDNIVAASWHERFYSSVDLALDDLSLLDWDIVIDRQGMTAKELPLILENGRISYRIIYQVSPPHFFAIPPSQAISLSNKSDLIAMLNSYPLKLYTATQSLISGSQIFHLQQALPPFDQKKLRSHDWNGVDIETEVGQAKSGQASIHEHVRSKLQATSPTLLFYDHATGEIADFIAIYQQTKQVQVILCHVKASCKNFAGARVEDLYEICGQAVKSVQWLKPQYLFARLLTREAQDTSRLIQSNVGNVNAFVTGYNSNPIPVVFSVILVQPGLSEEKLIKSNVQADKLLEILAATEDYILRVGDAAFQVWTSS